MRVCHLNTCPVGIATQDPALRQRFKGTPDQVVNYLMLVAEEVRSIMAGLGIRRFEDLIGRTDLLNMDEALEHWKARRVDLSMILSEPELPADTPRRRTRPQVPVLDDALDWELLRRCEPALERGEQVRFGPVPVRNVNRAVGGILSGEIARRRGSRGLPEGTVLRVGRPVVRGLAGPGCDLLPAGRDERLHRQGTVRRRGRRPAGRVGHVPGRGEHDRRQHRALRRHRRTGVLPRARR
jgi:hypothetical protein